MLHTYLEPLFPSFTLKKNGKGQLHETIDVVQTLICTCAVERNDR